MSDDTVPPDFIAVVAEIIAARDAILSVCARVLDGTRRGENIAMTAISMALATMWLRALSESKAGALPTPERIAGIVRSAPWEAHAHAAIVQAKTERWSLS